MAYFHGKVKYKLVGFWSADLLITLAGSINTILWFMKYYFDWSYKIDSTTLKDSNFDVYEIF